MIIFMTDVEETKDNQLFEYGTKYTSLCSLANSCIARETSKFNIEIKKEQRAFLEMSTIYLAINHNNKKCVRRIISTREHSVTF